MPTHAQDAGRVAERPLRHFREALPGPGEPAYEGRHLPEGTLGAARLAVLADALEDDGLTDAEVLGHLRSDGPHLRGCWAVDAVLGQH